MRVWLALTTATLLLAGLLFWPVKSDPDAGVPIEMDAALAGEQLPTLRGLARKERATGEATSPVLIEDRTWLDPAWEDPPRTRGPVVKPALTTSEIRAAGYDHMVPPGTAGGAVLIDGKPVEEGEALLWKVPSHMPTPRDIPLEREPDARIGLLRDGRFRFGGLEAGHYLVGAKLPDGIQRLRWSLDRRVKNERKEMLIVLGSGVIEGVVYDETGAPAAGWHVRAYNEGGVGNMHATVVVGSDGSYRIGFLPGGFHRVTLDDPQSKSEHTGVIRRVMVTKDQTTRVDFGGKKPVRLKGIVRLRHGEPVRRAGRIDARGPGGRTAIILYDGQGAYDHLLEAGSWAFRFHFGGDRWKRVTRVKLTPADAARDFSLDLAWIEGRVLHAPEVVPRDVRFWRADRTWSGTWLRVGADSRFYLPGVSDGRYKLQVWRRGVDTQVVTVEVRAGAVPHDVELPWEP